MSSAKKRGRILVVDDDQGVVDYLREQLEELGWESIGTHSAKTALERARTEEFDLLVADVEMPEIRGIDMIARLHADRPRLPIILITAFGTIELAVQALRAGASDFVTKPFRIETLALSIERTVRERSMRQEIARLRSNLNASQDRGLVARSARMTEILALARRAAGADSTILITGESGTGKGAVARFIHDVSPRSAGPYVQINCATLPHSLAESELFGVRKGAFTDAREDREGLFVVAHTGTLFLDEIGELTLEMQAKLLHVLESRRVRPVGGVQDVEANPRLLAATNRDLDKERREGRFRQDLYYRLNVIRIDIPPLRDRREDILPLVDVLLARISERSGKPVPALSAGATSALIGHGWPGNVRELSNVIERALVLSERAALQAEDLMLSVDREPDRILDDAAARGLTLEQVNKLYTRMILEVRQGNKAATARALGIDRRTLYRMLEDEVSKTDERAESDSDSGAVFEATADDDGQSMRKPSGPTDSA